MSFVNKIQNTITPTDIDSFKSTITRRSGLAPANRFVIFMQPPSATLLNFDLQQAASNFFSGNFSLSQLVNDPRDIAILCESCSIPGRQVQTFDHSHKNYRQSKKVPQGYFNEDVNFTFHLTNDYYMKKIFDRWVDIIINPESYKLSYKKDYVTDVTIQQLNQKNIPIYGIKLKNAFPTTVNSVDLNNTSSETQKLNVTLSFDDYETEGSIVSTINGLSDVIGGTLRRLI